MRLDEKRSVTDPGDTDLSGAQHGKFGGRVITGAFGEKSWNEDAGQVIALMPIRARPEIYPRRFFVPRSIFWRLTDYIPSTLFRKRNRHLRGTI